MGVIAAAPGARQHRARARRRPRSTCATPTTRSSSAPRPRSRSPSTTSVARDERVEITWRQTARTARGARSPPPCRSAWPQRRRARGLSPQTIISGRGARRAGDGAHVPGGDGVRARRVRRHQPQPARALDAGAVRERRRRACSTWLLAFADERGPVSRVVPRRDDPDGQRLPRHARDHRRASTSSRRASTTCGAPTSSTTSRCSRRPAGARRQGDRPGRALPRTVLRSGQRPDVDRARRGRLRGRDHHRAASRSEAPPARGVAPIYELDAGTGKRFNTAVVIDEHGEVLGTYRKTHIPHGQNEQGSFHENVYYDRSDGNNRLGPANVSTEPVLPRLHDQRRPYRRRHLLRPPLRGGDVVARGRGRRAHLLPSRHLRREEPAHVAPRVPGGRRAPQRLHRRARTAGASSRPGTSPTSATATSSGPTARCPTCREPEAHHRRPRPRRAAARRDPSGWNLPRDIRPDIYGRPSRRRVALRC